MMSSDLILAAWLRRLEDKRGECREIAYILNAPSKNLRSSAALALCSDAGLAADSDLCAAVAVSVELIHSASLIIDDLPSMDDASVRRGREAHHLVFGPDVTVLTAVDMIALAFEAAESVPGLSGELSMSLSALVQGQRLDLKANGEALQAALRIHEGKTGALFSYALAGAGFACCLSAETIDRLRLAGRQTGVIFQLADDMIDRAWTPEKAGKDTEKDLEKYTHT